MSEWIYGFFMAWGMFLAIPCPKKIWSESARRRMLACLPLVGLIAGGVWALCAWLGGFLPRPIGALLCAAAPWLVTGFMHLDGFMDVCDAVMSRRDMETRQRILKDSHCGAFAVICMVLLALGQWSVFLSAEGIALWPLALVPVGLTDHRDGLYPLRKYTRQYSAMERGGAPVVFAALVLAAACITAALVWDSFAPLAAAAVYALAAWYGVKQLGGMSGDVSGFALTLAELGGAAALVLWR